jgi:hypothetical protein
MNLRVRSEMSGSEEIIRVRVIMFDRGVPSKIICLFIKVLVYIYIFIYIYMSSPA